MQQYDLVVIGAGSGGAGAAITAGRLGLRTLWIEKEALLGGTGVNAFVNVWQPGYTTSALARELADRLIAREEATFLAPRQDTPSGRPLFRATTDCRYEDTLKRWAHRPTGLNAPGIVYTPGGMDAMLRALAAATGHIELRDRTVLVDARTEPAAGGMRRLVAITLQGPEGESTVRAGHFIDAGADIPLAIRAGCAWTIGREAADTYNEPSAPPYAEFTLNGPTLCFMVRPGPGALPEVEPCGHDSDWAHIGELPGGGYYVNMVYQLPGESAWMMGGEQTREYLLGNIARRWPLVQRAYGLEGYGICAIAPRIGVREGPRLLARYVLTERDYHAGRFGAHHEDCVAFTDHALDRHAPGGGCTEAQHGPVGIPFRCLQPRNIENLLVACRGAGFSSLTASAVRLQRTVMELGEAAAAYVATGTVPRPILPAYTG